MTKNYHYRFPIFIHLARWQVTIGWQPPIVKLPEQDISGFFHMFDDDPRY
jgi:hypothetical protein